jgi:hypothetical protein
VARPGFQHQHIQPALSKFLGDDGAAAARSDDDDVSLEIAFLNVV